MVDFGSPRTVSAKTLEEESYFNLPYSFSAFTPSSPVWPRLRSPTQTPTIPSTSPTASRASWSSLFYPGTVRQFMTGSQEMGQTMPSENPPAAHTPHGHISHSPAASPSTQRWKGPPGVTPVLSRSWGESKPVTDGRSAIPFTPNQPKATPLRRHSTAPAPVMQEKRSVPTREKTRLVVFEEPTVIESQEKSLLAFSWMNMQPELIFSLTPMFQPYELEQLISHIHCYAEILFRWRQFHKRLELLKSIRHSDTSENGSQHAFGMYVQ